ncbi:hypothetical protein B0I35DRAFT_499116 [Stachybotrys elegans]|uniref:Transmembrane protein n=1 Tax=Stachybotrys elegans TaxID=80388 RepID=A0A8K0WSS6_9HYPO|nr:hypothetical protein B0I35DRAFT_499116 [Stachybotrys elegans]
MNCSSSRLSELVANNDVEFDADIAGPGVLVAFVVTSLAALITLMAAFVTLSTPSRLLNASDTVISRILRDVIKWISKRLRWKPNRTEGTDGQEERISGFSSFMISLSDQLLASEAAILIAGLIIHEEVTLYSMNIIIALGCLASTVHMATFAFFIDSIRQHRTAKIIRVIMMIAASGMLIFLLIVQISMTWDLESHVFLACTLRDYQIPSDVFGVATSLLVPIYILYGTIDIIRLLYAKEPGEETNTSHQPDRNNTHNFMGLPSYRNEAGIELQELRPNSGQADVHYNHRPPETEQGEAPGARNSLNSRRPQDNADIESNRATPGELRRPATVFAQLREIFGGTRPSQRDKLVDRWLRGTAVSTAVSTAAPNRFSTVQVRIRLRLAAETWAFVQCQSSFVSRWLWLWSGNVYGITSVFIARAETSEAGMSGNRDEMGFGQVVPLVLLVLPFLAALQSYSDYLVKANALNQKRQTAEFRGERRQQNSLREVWNQPSHQGARRPPPNSEEALASEQLEVMHVLNRIEQRCNDINAPWLYDWVLGDRLHESQHLRRAVITHTIYMFVFTTLLGFGQASGYFPTLTFVLLILLIVMAFGKVAALVRMHRNTTSNPHIMNFLDLLDKGVAEQQRRPADHAEGMMMVHASQGIQPDPDNPEEQ